MMPIARIRRRRNKRGPASIAGPRGVIIQFYNG